MLSALSFLTIFGPPTAPSRHTFRWFAVVGAGLGAAVGGVHLGAHVLWPPLVAAALVLAADLLFTGALHLDGLADSADGLGAQTDLPRRLELMAEPGIGALAGRLVRSVATAVALTAAGRELRRVARRVGEAAAAGDLPRAREELPALVGRDPSSLDASGVAAAAIESVAENSVDAVLAPAFWAVVAGAPGAFAYRAINTMDAMVGHRNERYGRFGWATARLDDLANYLPARIFAALVAAAAPERAGAVLETVRRDAPAHPSPNAGVAEAALAAALGRQLGGPLRYGRSVENRPRPGHGRHRSRRSRRCRCSHRRRTPERWV